MSRVAEGGRDDHAMIQPVLSILRNWERLDLAAALSDLSDDAVFVAGPRSEPVCGRAAIESLWTCYMQLFATYECEVQNIAIAGPVVFVERTERILRRDGRKVVLPVATVFEVDDAGRIAAWRDYWDPAMAESPSDT